MSRATFMITESMLSSILRVNFDKDDIAKYLSKDHYELEEFLLRSTESKLVLADQCETLRSIVIFNYEEKFLEFIQSLWKTYQKSAQDKLNIEPDIQEIDRKVRPNEIQCLVDEFQTLLFGRENRRSSSSSNRDLRNSRTYLVFTESCLAEIEKRLKRLQHRSKEAMKQLTMSPLRDRLKAKINEFVLHELMPIKYEIDCQVELVHYDYIDEIELRQFYNTTLNLEQVKFFEYFHCY